MCCEETVTVATDRDLLDGCGWDWGDDRIDLFRWARFSRLDDVFSAFTETGDWSAAVRLVIGDEVPAGIVVIRVDGEGLVRAEVGPPRLAIAGRTVPIDVVVDSTADRDLTLTVAGRKVQVDRWGTAIRTLDIDGADRVIRVDAGSASLAVAGAVRTVPAARLRLTSPACARWSVTDADGGAWLPDEVPARWDVHDRADFDGHDVTVAVPAGPLHVVCARGNGLDRVEREVGPGAGETLVVEYDPPGLPDPEAGRWYGGDLHVHLDDDEMLRPAV
jgi:hypothetical protein